MVSLMVILFSRKCFLFIYMYIDLLKLKGYKVFENSDADLSWFLFKRSHLVHNICSLVFGILCTRFKNTFSKCFERIACQNNFVKIYSE